MVPQELFGDVVCFTVTTFDVETVDDVLFLLGFHEFRFIGKID
jgi:hypothetical protein